MAKRLPKTIYVYREEGGDEEYLIANETVDDVQEDKAGSVIGIYILEKTKRLQVTKKLK